LTTLSTKRRRRQEIDHEQVHANAQVHPNTQIMPMQDFMPMHKSCQCTDHDDAQVVKHANVQIMPMVKF
jgi:hypothetical protein